MSMLHALGHKINASGACVVDLELRLETAICELLLCLQSWELRALPLQCDASSSMHESWHDISVSSVVASPVERRGS